MQSIGDALGIDYQGAQANISHIGRASFSTSALFQSSRLHAPSLRPGGPDIGQMISKENDSLGDNIDVFA